MIISEIINLCYNKQVMKKILSFFGSLFFISSAGAVAPIVWGVLGGVGVIAGFSIYRSFVPVDMVDALKFFSSCWSCQLFSGIMSTMSGLLPRVYHAIGIVTIPIAATLTAVWFGWTLLSGYIGMGKVEQDPWSLSGKFGTHIIKLALVIGLLAFPLPRLITNVVIEPVFNIGLAINRLVTSDVHAGTQNENSFESCLVSTALADPAARDNNAATSGAYSPALRHNLSCQLAGIHQMTGLGMTAGWTMLNSAFDSQYMHKLMWNVPIFPNIGLLLAGLAILVIFLYALLPVPLYFLEIFIELTFDLIMLPLILLSWLFKDWQIVKFAGDNTLQKIIDRVISGTVGIALVGIFVSFAVIFLNSIFGNFSGINGLAVAFEKNDPKFLIDGLLMQNNSMITIIMVGLFIAMFMNMIPTLVKELFKVNVSQEYYNKAKKDLNGLREGAINWYKSIKKS